MRPVIPAIIAAALTTLTFVSRADFEFIRLPPNTPVAVDGGRAVFAQAGEQLSIYRIDDFYAAYQHITATSETNTTYLLTYTNAVGNVATNITDYDVSPFPAGYQYIAYWTNTVVTTTAVTNYINELECASTNEIE